MEAAATPADGEQSVPLLAEGGAAQAEAGAEAETEAMDEDDGEEAAGDAEVAAVDVPAASNSGLGGAAIASLLPCQVWS